MINAAFTFVSKFPNLTTVSGTSLWYIQLKREEIMASGFNMEILGQGWIVLFS